MKKLLCATLALIPLAACAQDPNVKAYCNNTWQTGSPGIVNITSQHGVTIINKTPLSQTYHVAFDNAVQYGKLREMPLDYSDPPFTPNAHSEYNLTVDPGKTLNYGPITIARNAYFFKRGRYKTSATTTIILNGYLLDQCVHYTNVDIT